MTEYCSKCGEALKEDAIFCANCGEKVPNRHKGLSRNHLILIVVAVILLAATASIFLMSNQTQTVRVGDVKFQLPADYVNEPDRTEVSIDENVKSSAMGWSNDKHYIEIGVTNTPGSGFDSEEVAAGLGGTPTRCMAIQAIILNMKMRGVPLFLD